MNRTLRGIYEQAAKGEFPTDKNDANHTTFGRSYLDVYDEIFSGMSGRIRSILELGVLFGGSLWLWKAYAPSAKVVGVDINPESKSAEERGCKVVIGSQTDRDVLLEAKRMCGGGFSLVVDDGSHVIDHMIESWRILWPSVDPGGYYVIEDTRCTYTPTSQDWPGMRFNKIIPDNNRADFSKWILDAIYNLDHGRGSAESISIYPMQVVMRKSRNQLTQK